MPFIELNFIEVINWLAIVKYGCYLLDLPILRIDLVHVIRSIGDKESRPGIYFMAGKSPALLDVVGESVGVQEF